MGPCWPRHVRSATTTQRAGRTVADFENIAYRDSLGSDGKDVWVDYQTLYPFLDKINRSGTAVYLIDGWYDIYARDDFLIYENLTVPKRLLVRPTDHAGIEAPGSDVDFGAEAHRWFDYWLKGIDNGIMDEPPIHYYLQGADKAQAWQSTDSWPLKDQQTANYYFGPGQGWRGVRERWQALSLSAPSDPSAVRCLSGRLHGHDRQQPAVVRAGAAAQVSRHATPRFQVLDVYNAPPWRRPWQVVGHPIVHVWLTTNAPDLDVFAYLEQVDGKGNSTYITEGELRASHRLLSAAPFENFGLPWRDHLQSELQPIPAGEPVELVFDLRPTAWQFAPGSHLRITMAFADAGNFDTPVLDPAPALQLLRESSHPSHVELPIIP